MGVMIWTECSIETRVVGFDGSMIVVECYYREHGKSFDMFLVVDGNRCFFDFSGMIRVDVVVMDEVFVKGELSLKHILFSIFH